MNIYRIIFETEPSIEHPKFFEWQYSGIGVWLLDNSDESASSRAHTIVSQLPYELLGDPLVQSLDTPEKVTARGHEADRQCLQCVLELGLAMQVMRCPVGTEASDFFGDR